MMTRTVYTLGSSEAEIQPHSVSLNKKSISYQSVDWCDENCKGKWSWWFDEALYCHLTFELESDLVMWSLSMYDKEREQNTRTL